MSSPSDRREDDVTSTDQTKAIYATIPPITLSNDSVRFYRSGMTWYVQTLTTGSGNPTDRHELAAQIADERRVAEEFLESSERLREFDLSDETAAEEAFAKVDAQHSWPEWWAFLFVALAAALEESSAVHHERDAILWRLGKVRTMLMFTRHLEPIVWRGYQSFGADTIAQALGDWETSDKNATEEYWQKFLEERPFLIGLISTGPAKVHQGKAYLGGKRIDNTGGKVIDFLLEHSVSGSAALLEIKKPRTQLLGSRYRGDDIFAISADLAGAVSQVLNYRDTLVKAGYDAVSLFHPTCIILAGDYAAELDTEAKRRSFELFRSSLSGVVIITFDELIERLAKVLDVLRETTPK